MIVIIVGGIMKKKKLGDAIRLNIEKNQTKDNIKNKEA